MARTEQLDLFFQDDAEPSAGLTTPAPLAPGRRAPAPPPHITHESGAQLAPAIIPTPCPLALPMGARWREVRTEQQLIGFTLMRSRRRSIGFVITDDGLRVTAPNWVTLAQIDEAVVEKARWILSKLRDWYVRKEKLALSHTRWQAGGELPYLGKRIELALGAPGRQAFIEGNPDAPEDGAKLWLALPADADNARVRDAAQAWLQGRAREWIGARLAHFLQSTGLKIRRWRLSAAATRWGSCTSDGNIMLNWRLIHFAPYIVDYVVAHELAHLREMNHSRDFWAEVEAILPQYEQAREALRAHDPSHLPD
jgi:predicted metal-dependent hydrolase